MHVCIRAKQSQLFPCEKEKKDVVPDRVITQSGSHGEQHANPNCVVSVPVIDRIAIGVGRPDAEMIVMRSEHDGLLARTRKHARDVVGAHLLLMEDGNVVHGQTELTRRFEIFGSNKEAREQRIRHGVTGDDRRE
jgi:hypothetical protein